MRMTFTLLLTLALLVVPGLGFADETPAKDDLSKADLAKPSVAWRDINMGSRKIAYAKRREHVKAEAAAYLAAFSAKGSMALGSEALSFAFIQRGAQQWESAAVTFRSIWANAENPETLRDQAAMHEAGLLAGKELREILGGETCLKSLESLTSYSAGLGTDTRLAMRSSIENNLARVLDAIERKQDAHDLRVAVVTRDPTMVSRMYRSLVSGLLGSTHALDGYEKVRADVKPLLELLAAQQAKAVELAEAKHKQALANLGENSPASVDENGKLKPKPRNQMSMLEKVAYSTGRQLGSAKSYVTRIEKAGKPFQMLGEPAPAWTLEHAFGDLQAVADLKGKVVVLDFWATWCPWCIKSFPAIRDLLRDYEAKGLVVVGVTASSGSVYAARYDLDDDLKDKGVPGKRATPAARRVRGSQEPDGKTLFSAEDYPAKEREVIHTFIENHKMTWPVVMIDKTEPGPKYALGGWPHAVVLDRQGRVRYFKSGALLRDKVDAVKKFRALLEDLLAEKAK